MCCNNDFIYQMDINISDDARYIVVVHPFKLVGFLSRSKCRLAVFLLWFLSWLLSIPVIFSTVNILHSCKSNDSKEYFVISYRRMFTVSFTRTAIKVSSSRFSNVPRTRLVTGNLGKVRKVVERHNSNEEIVSEIEFLLLSGRAMSVYQLLSLLLIPALITIFCYQAVIRVLWRSVK